MTLRQHVHTLSNPHLTTGPAGPVTVPALLDELDAAVHPTSGGGASASSSKAKLPLDEGALALRQDIDALARELQEEMIGTASRDTKAILRSWAASVPTVEWEAYLTGVTRGWCEQIEAYLRPEQVYRPSVPCPSCGARFHGEDRAQAVKVTLTRDGQDLHPSEWVMACAVCSAEWSGDALGSIAHAIANSDAA